jgi:hypothetical protein
MNDANVKLSKNELPVVTDAALILTKNSIIAKVYTMFGLLSSEWQAAAEKTKTLLPEEAYRVSPKIYKGEQYMGLPYVMLDYPRVYTGGHVLAVRCFFLWGNFFSITLHLQGRFMQYRAARLHAWVQAHSGQGWFIGINTDAWQHHFGENNYCSIDVMGQEILNNALNAGNGFVKLAKKIPLEQWDEAMQFFRTERVTLMQVFEN